MKLFSALAVAALALGLLALPARGSMLQFGLTGSSNTDYAVGVMGGATAAGSGIPRHVTAADNVVVTRATLGRPPAFLLTLTGLGPGEPALWPALTLVTVPTPADPGLVPFSPGGTVATEGAY